MELECKLRQLEYDEETVYCDIQCKQRQLMDLAACANDLRQELAHEREQLTSAEKEVSKCFLA